MAARRRQTSANQTKKYKKNFLKKVIFRIDFSEVNLNFLSTYYSKIKGTFPFEKRENVTNVLFVDSKAPEQKNLMTTVWTFISADKSKRIQIASNNILIEYDKYSDKKELLEDVEKFISPFIFDAKVNTINRVGLRYTNLINLSDVRGVFSWKKYIAKDLIDQIGFMALSVGGNLSRAIGKLIVRKETVDISFTYGLINSDFPSESLRREYTLDYDCYSRLPIDPQSKNIIEVVKEYNSYIEKLFESSIEDSLRKIMKK